jgi:hypothetical protein
MFKGLAVAVACWLGLYGAAVRAEEPVPVDLQLVLGIDSSSSVQMSQFYLQLEGYAAAFSHPDLLKAIQSGEHQAIAVALFEWSGPQRQQINLDWRVLRDQADLTDYAKELANSPRLLTGGPTAIGSAIDFATKLFEDSGTVAERRVIDISGDGASNQGRSVTAARDAAVARGITINGLAVLHQEPDLADHYRRFVVAGPHAFVLTATSYADFAEAILRKLVREITVADQRQPVTTR